MAFSLLFLGTCACDYSPLLKTEYKDSFDKNARRSSCVLLNGQILIDCGEHCLDSLRIAKIPYSQITDIVITHLHADHYNAEHILRFAEGRTNALRVWVREDAIVPEIAGVEWIKMKLKNSYSLGNGLRLTGYIANHDQNVFPQHLLFEKDGKKFLYACDGGWLMTETYNALKNAKLSLLVLDGTCGDYEGEWRMAEHNSIPMIRLMLPSLKNWGMIDESTQIYISHLAPSLHLPHDETSVLMAKEGVKVAYDGLKLEN